MEGSTPRASLATDQNTDQNFVTNVNPRRNLAQKRDLTDKITETINHLPIEDVQYVQLALAGEEKIRRECKIEIKSSDLQPSTENGVNSRFMGTTPPNNTSCAVCDQESCGGHFGYIHLEEPVFHPYLMKETISVMNSVCHDCGELLIPYKKLVEFNPNIEKLSGSARLNAYVAVSKLCRSHLNDPKVEEKMKKRRTGPLNKKDEAKLTEEAAEEMQLYGSSKRSPKKVQKSTPKRKRGKEQGVAKKLKKRKKLASIRNIYYEDEAAVEGSGVSDDESGEDHFEAAGIDDSSVSSDDGNLHRRLDQETEIKTEKLTTRKRSRYSKKTPKQSETKEERFKDAGIPDEESDRESEKESDKSNSKTQPSELKDVWTDEKDDSQLEEGGSENDLPNVEIGDDDDDDSEDDENSRKKYDSDESEEDEYQKKKEVRYLLSSKTKRRVRYFCEGLEKKHKPCGGKPECGKVSPVVDNAQTKSANNQNLNLKIVVKNVELNDKGEKVNIMKDLTARDVYEIFSKINPDDASHLGFSEGSLPKSMIITHLPVLPPIARPGHPAFNNEESQSDPLTTQYVQVIKNNNTIKACRDVLKEIYVNVTKLKKKIENLGNSPKTEDSERNKNKLKKDCEALGRNRDIKEGVIKAKYALIYKAIHTIFITDPSDKRVNNSKFLGLGPRLKGKTGVYRQLTQGKRSDLTGRAVVSPGNYLRFTEVGVPDRMARRLPIPYTVTKANLEETYALLNAGKLNSHTPYNVDESGMRVKGQKIKLDIGDQPSEIKEGDEVSRNLRDGDVVLFNRQPTIHYGSITAYTARIIKGNNITFHSGSTTIHNLDHDGDEGNIIAVVAPEAIMEAWTLMHASQNMVNNKHSKANVGLVLDLVTMSYLGTCSKMIVKKEIFDYVLSHRDYAKESDFDPDIDEAQMLVDFKSDLQNRARRYGLHPYSGATLFSAMLPKGFSYEKDGVLILNGILVKGQITGSHVGTTQRTILQDILHHFDKTGPYEGVKFMTNATWMLIAWMDTIGFSVGPADVDFARGSSIKTKHLKEMREKIMKMGSFPHDDPLAAEKEKERILFYSDISTRIGREMGFTKMKEGDFKGTGRANLIGAMCKEIGAGAKADPYNVGQLGGAVGVQTYYGSMWEADRFGRVLPVQPFKTDPSMIAYPEERGVVTQSFMEGLTPVGNYYHQRAGREGSNATNLDTADFGNAQRLFTRSMENTKEYYDGTIRSVAANSYNPEEIESALTKFRDDNPEEKTIHDILLTDSKVGKADGPKAEPFTHIYTFGWRNGDQRNPAKMLNISTVSHGNIPSFVDLKAVVRKRNGEAGYFNRKTLRAIWNNKKKLEKDKAALGISEYEKSIKGNPDPSISANIIKGRSRTAQHVISTKPMTGVRSVLKRKRVDEKELLEIRGKLGPIHEEKEDSETTDAFNISFKYEPRDVSDLKKNLQFGDNSFYKSHVAPNLFQDYSEKLLESTIFKPDEVMETYNPERTDVEPNKSPDVEVKRRKTISFSNTKPFGKGEGDNFGYKTKGRRNKRVRFAGETLPQEDGNWMLDRVRKSQDFLGDEEGNEQLSSYLLSELTTFFRVIKMFPNRFPDFDKHFSEETVSFFRNLLNGSKDDFESKWEAAVYNLFGYEEGISIFQDNKFIFSTQNHDHERIYSLHRNEQTNTGIAIRTENVSIPEREMWKDLLPKTIVGLEKFIDKEFVLAHLPRNYLMNMEYFYFDDSVLDSFKKAISGATKGKYYLYSLDSDVFFTNRFDYVSTIDSSDEPLYQLLDIKTLKIDQIITQYAKYKRVNVFFWKLPFYNHFLGEEVAGRTLNLLKGHKDNSVILFFPTHPNKFRLTATSPSSFTALVGQNFTKKLENAAKVAKINFAYDLELTAISKYFEGKESVSRTILWHSNDEDNSYPGQISLFVVRRTDRTEKIPGVTNMLLRSLVPENPENGDMLLDG